MWEPHDLELPVVAAPMAGGASTAGLAAAVTAAGGLGFLAAGYKTPDAVAAEVHAARSATSGPLGVNLFVVEPYEPDPLVVRAYARSLEPEAVRLGVTLGHPHWDDDCWQAKLDAIHDLRPEVVSFTFGCPPAAVLRRLAQREIHPQVTVTTVAEARKAVTLGAASITVQGPDAGGHRGSWDPDSRPDPTPLLDLLPEVLAAVRIPVVAAGGVFDAAGTRAVLRRGAVAVQAGTAYLLADEAGTNAVHRTALVDPAFARTGLTRAYTGRWARGLVNRFMAEHTDAPAGYPHLHHLTAPLRAAAVAAGDAQVAHLWAGTGHARSRPGSAAEITRSLGG